MRLKIQQYILLLFILLAFLGLFEGEFANAQSGEVCKFKDITVELRGFNGTRSNNIFKSGARIIFNIEGTDACKNGGVIPYVSITAGRLIRSDLALANEKKITFLGPNTKASLAIEAGEDYCDYVPGGFDCIIRLTYDYSDGQGNRYSSIDFGDKAVGYYECLGTLCSNDSTFGPLGILSGQIEFGDVKEAGQGEGNLVCAVKDTGSGAFVCPTHDGKVLNPKNCKEGQACESCDADYKECVEPADMPENTESGCFAIKNTQCSNVSREEYVCSKDKKCVIKRTATTEERRGKTYNGEASCRAECERNFDPNQFGGLSGYQSPPSEPIEFSYKVPNLLEKNNVTNLAELIDFILSNIMRFLIPLAVILIVYQGMRLLLNPVLGAFGYDVPEKNIYKNIGYVLGGLAIILIGRGFVTLVLSIFNPPGSG